MSSDLSTCVEKEGSILVGALVVGLTVLFILVVVSYDHPKPRKFWSCSRGFQVIKCISVFLPLVRWLDKRSVAKTTGLYCTRHLFLPKRFVGAMDDVFTICHRK